MPPPPAATADDAMPQSVVVDVLAPVAVDTAYSYRAPSGLKLEPGAFVRMPLGARIATGVVWAARPAGGDNLKPIAEILDWPPLRTARLHRLDGALDLGAARHALAHGDPSRRSRRAARAEVWTCRHRQGAD